MKICSGCSFCESKVIQTNNGYMNAMVCMNPECRDVLEGGPIPCIAARQQEVYCGFQARYYNKKEEIEDAKVVSLIQKS